MQSCGTMNDVFDIVLNDTGHLKLYLYLLIYIKY